MTMDITLGEYKSEVEKLAKDIKNKSNGIKDKSHEIMNSQLRSHSWITDFGWNFDVLKHTENLGEIDQTGQSCATCGDIITFLQKAAFWGFYGDVSDKIKELND